MMFRKVLWDIRNLFKGKTMIFISGLQLKPEANIFLPFQRKQSSSPVLLHNIISNIDVKIWTSLLQHWLDMLLNMLEEKSFTYKSLLHINKPKSRTSLVEDWILLCWNSMAYVALFQLKDIWTWKCKVIFILVFISDSYSVFLYY